MVAIVLADHPTQLRAPYVGANCSSWICWTWGGGDNTGTN